MDTNGFSEVSQAPDRDLRDNAVYDGILIQLLKNTNLSLAELNMAGDALNNVIYNSDYKFAITEAKADSYISDPNILGFISDLVLQKEGVDICIVYGKTTSNQMKLSVRSCTNIMSAKEIAAAVTNGNRICVRTLEADFNIESSDNIYLMILKSGSVYPITKEKFERTYSLCDSDFIFDGEYEPRVFTLKDGEMISQPDFWRFG